MKHTCILLSALFFFICFFSYGSERLPNYDFYADGFTFKHMGFDNVMLCNGAFEITEDTVVIPETVTYGLKNYKVTLINNIAFFNHDKIKHVSIPNSVVVIGSAAFAKCKNLTSVEIPFGVVLIDGKAFEDCPSLKSIAIPGSVKFIGPRAFSNCPNLEEIKIESDNPYLFYDSGILFNKERTVVLAALYDLEGEVHIPNSVTHISSRAFLSQHKINSIVFPPDLKSIGEESFWSCGMDSIFFKGNKLDSIGNRSFEYCHKLKSICFPEGLKFIGTSAFSKCIKLSDVTFPSDLEILGSEVFADTPWLENQPDGEIYINDILYAYKNPPSDLTSVTIREGTKSIASSVFENCSTLQTVIFPESIKFIGEKAFWWCVNLENVNLPDGIMYIGKSAFERMGDAPFHKTKWYKKAKNGPIYLGKVFYGYKTNKKNTNNMTLDIKEGIEIMAGESLRNCKNFEKIEIPRSVTYIGPAVFTDKIGWKELIVHWENPSEVLVDDSYIYYLELISYLNLKNCVLKVPRNAYDNYNSVSFWKQFNIQTK